MTVSLVISSSFSMDTCTMQVTYSRKHKASLSQGTQTHTWTYTSLYSDLYGDFMGTFICLGKTLIPAITL